MGEARRTGAVGMQGGIGRVGGVDFRDGGVGGGVGYRDGGNRRGPEVQGRRVVGW